METNYALTELLGKVRDEKARVKEDLRLIIGAQTFFRKFPRAIASLHAKYETLDKMERWVVEKLRKEHIFDEIW